MKCPNCQSDSNSVTNSRPAGNMIRRRRECDVCGRRWSTLEIEVSSVDRIEAYTRTMKEKAKLIRDEVELLCKTPSLVAAKGRKA